LGSRKSGAICHRGEGLECEAEQVIAEPPPKRRVVLEVIRRGLDRALTNKEEFTRERGELTANHKNSALPEGLAKILTGPRRKEEGRG